MVDQSKSRALRTVKGQCMIMDFDGTVQRHASAVMHCKHIAEFYRRKALTCSGRAKRQCEALAWDYMNAAVSAEYAAKFFRYY